MAGPPSSPSGSTERPRAILGEPVVGAAREGVSSPAVRNSSYWTLEEHVRCTTCIRYLGSGNSESATREAQVNRPSSLSRTKLSGYRRGSP